MKKKLKKKKKEFSKSRHRHLLHALWSETVRTRDGYACQWCAFDGKHNVNLKHHGHHIVPRSVSGTNGAFDVDNGVTLCFPCHIFRLKSEVDEYIAFRNDWLDKNVGIDYFELREKFSPIVKFNEEFYKIKKDSLEYVLSQIRR